jgi:Zn-dependent protease/predicted transcriptional regulator
MKWSIRLARIAGIDVRLHLTFLVLLAWIAWSHYQSTGSLLGAMAGLVTILLVFGSVVLHEYGHALVARRYGIRTRDITLLPIGGVAALERMPEEPRAELAVAVAGPAVNLVLAGVFFAAVALLGRLLPANPVIPGASLLEQLAWINIALAVFNMIPAFPMDGGRVLRALLSMRLGHARATQLAATLGQGLALLAGIIGLFGNPLLIFVALFVWLGAASEGRTAALESVMEGIAVQFAMARDVRSVAPGDGIAVAVEQVLAGHQQDLPVLEDGRVVGVLTRADLLRALAQQGLETTVAKVMQTDFEVAHPNEMLRAANARLESCACDSMPVVLDDGRVVGMLTSDSIRELVLVRTALEEGRRA